MSDEWDGGWGEEVRSNLRALKYMHTEIRGHLIFGVILFLGNSIFNRKCNFRYKFSFILLKTSFSVDIEFLLQ